LLDALFVPLGGGGLLSGCLIAAKNTSPECEVFGVEPAAGDDGLQSLRAGKLITIDSPRTIADGAQTPSLGTVTFPVIQAHVDDIFTATDEELISEMKFFAERLKLIVEPTGCLGLAAVRRLKDRLYGKRVGVIISGGNVDLGRFAEFVGNNKT
jgi:threonine dehydratase